MYEKKSTRPWPKKDEVYIVNDGDKYIITQDSYIGMGYNYDNYLFIPCRRYPDGTAIYDKFGFPEDEWDDIDTWELIESIETRYYTLRPDGTWGMMEL